MNQRATQPVKALYVSLEGGLLGPQRSLFEDGDGVQSMDGVMTPWWCLTQNIEIVPMSLQRRPELSEAARLLGARSFIGECGAVLVDGGEHHWLIGDYRTGPSSVYAQIRAEGIPARTAGGAPRAPGLRQSVDNGQAGREVTHLFRGAVDTEAANTWPSPVGLELVDNGPLPGASRHGPGATDIHSLVLRPMGSSNAVAVAEHMKLRGIKRREAVAVVSSRQGLSVARARRSVLAVAQRGRRRSDPGGGRRTATTTSGSRAGGTLRRLRDGDQHAQPVVGSSHHPALPAPREGRQRPVQTHTNARAPAPLSRRRRS